ncbi:T9SS type A sorting domain-containing protein [Flavobacterium faecale]|uniref:T9SS type A sorting domain-containing protein n=1 Tax=Flavobacterium faecale TaxID=1355330 RepID=UPI003AAF25C8
MKTKFFLLVALVTITSFSFGQTTLFFDNFNPVVFPNNTTENVNFTSNPGTLSDLASGYTYTGFTSASGGWNTAGASASGRSCIYSGNTFNTTLSFAGQSTPTNLRGTLTTSVSLSSFAAGFNPILKNNTAEITWSFAMRLTKSTPFSLLPGALNSGAGHCGGVILATNAENNRSIADPTATSSGYVVLIHGDGSNNAVSFGRFTSGLRTLTTTSPTESTFTPLLKVDDIVAGAAVSIIVTYTPNTNTWSLKVRKDGTNSLLLDPEAATAIAYTNSVPVSIVDATHTGISNTNMMMYFNQANNNTMNLDNLKVSTAASSNNSKTTSLLWGENGELWDSRGRIPDFSYAGYGGGYAVKPVFSNIINVLDHGVIPNDGLSDVAAIDALIKSAPNNSVIYFPAGRYVIDNWLKIARSNIIIRGAGEGVNGTVFYMPKSATDINSSNTNGYAEGDKGHMIEFAGGSQSTITTITEEALRTDKVIVVASASNLKVGDIIEINASGGNLVNGELWYEFFNNQTQDWPLPHQSWLNADGGSMYHTIEKIEGNLVTLREPLRLNIKPSWNMLVQKRTGALTNVGIENLRLEFIEVPKLAHLDEVGYNALQFNSCYNFWSKNISIVNSDNGILLTRSAYGEIENISMLGREGHHGFKIAYSANNVLNGIHFNNAAANIHSITIIHKANGNVVRNVTADNTVNNNTISLDFHRNAPFSNLWTNVKSPWSFKSSGNSGAGPHAGARNVYWGLVGVSTAMFWDTESDWKDNWGIYQGTIVSGLSTSEKFTDDREWYENVPNLAEKDLYTLQQKYRAEVSPELVFNDNAYGNRGDWKERDGSRWKVRDINGNNRYSLLVNNLPPVSNGKLSEYSVINIPQRARYEVKARVKLINDLATRTESDIAIVTSFSDDKNYLFARLSTNANNSGLYRVSNNSVTKLIGSTATLATNDYINLAVAIDGNDIIFIKDNIEIARANNVANITFGKVGIGSSKNGITVLKFEESENILSVNDNTIMGVKIYPNPVDDEFFVSLQDFLNTTISIYNMNGQLVYKTKANKELIKIATKGLFPSGVYLVKVSDLTGKSYTEKMVVK